MAVSWELPLPWAPGHRLLGGRDSGEKREGPATAQSYSPSSHPLMPEGLWGSASPRKGQVRIQGGSRVKWRE